MDRIVRGWIDLDEDGDARLSIPAVVPNTMTVDASRTGFEASGLLDASGRPLGRYRRGPGFGIYSGGSR